MRVQNDILFAIRNRDPRAGHLLYDTYAAALYGNILRLIPEPGKASTILEESFIEIWRTISLYNESHCKLYTWMFAITMKHCNKHLKLTQMSLMKLVIPRQVINGYKFELNRVQDPIDHSPAKI